MDIPDRDDQESSVQQVNVAYVAEEDRIVVRVALDYGEKRFWMTRRCLTVFWPILVDRLSKTFSVAMQTDSESKEMVLEFEHQKTIGSADLGRSYKYEQDEISLGNKCDSADQLQNSVSSDFVITQMQIPNESSCDAWSVTFLSMTGLGITLNMPLEFWHSFAHMLVQAAESGEWSLNLGFLTQKSGAVIEMESKGRMLH